MALSAPARAAEPLALAGRYQQGGFAIGRTAPGAQTYLDGQAVTRASPAGFFIIGFDRDASARSTLRVAGSEGETSRTLDIARGDFDVQRITVGPVIPGTASPELEARIAAESRRKAAAFASRSDRDDFRNGFSSPVRDFRVTARYGGQRILNGVPRPPHYGIDLAAPRGTPVYAPAGGVVLLAENGMLFEGGLIMIDHGQGLVAAYLHLSSVDVLRGQSVTRGERIGAVGATGRATGPHLCWRLKWRGRNMNPMLLVGAQTPV
ncbi:peptidase M24 [Phenylobacterium sp. Root700]|nr:peptidase M24 [Phenylobacterium sp. Root700]